MQDRPIVALDDTLEFAREALKAEGFDVVSLRHGGSQADAVVVSGMDTNMMGMENRDFEASVIEATGLDANEIVEQVRRSVGLKL